MRQRRCEDKCHEHEIYDLKCYHLYRPTPNNKGINDRVFARFPPGVALEPQEWGCRAASLSRASHPICTPAVHPVRSVWSRKLHKSYYHPKIDCYLTPCK